MEGINDDVQPYKASEYIQTAHTMNRVSRKAVLYGTSNIVLGGKCILHSGAIIRGDLRRAIAASSQGGGAGSGSGSGSTATQQQQTIAVGTGRYCVVGQGAILRPPYKTYKGVFSFYPIKMGDFVHVGASTVVEAAGIGSHVDIGRDCIISRFVTIKDSCRLLDGSVVSPHTTIPSGQIWAGNPAKHVADLPEMWSELHEARCRDYYAKFRPAAAPS